MKRQYYLQRYKEKWCIRNLILQPCEGIWKDILNIPNKLTNSIAVKLRIRSTTSDDVIIKRKVTSSPYAPNDESKSKEKSHLT